MKMEKAIKSKRVYVIAEIGGNFTKFEEAKNMIDAAAECGCDAVKLQTYRAETLTSREAFFAFETTGNIPQYEMFRKYEIDEKLHKKVCCFVIYVCFTYWMFPACKRENIPGCC